MAEVIDRQVFNVTLDRVSNGWSVAIWRKMHDAKPSEVKTEFIAHTLGEAIDLIYTNVVQK